MRIQIILIINLFCLNIYSADLAEKEKCKITGVSQKDWEDLTKIVDELDKPELQIALFDQISLKDHLERRLFCEGREEEHDKLKAVIGKLIKPSSELYLDPKPKEIDKKFISDQQMADPDIIFDVDHFDIGSAKNIKKIVNDSIPVIIYTALTANGDLSCEFYTKINNYRCVLKNGNKIYRSKNGKQDFEIIQRMHEKQKADYAKLYHGLKEEDLSKLAQGEFIPMEWNII